MAMLRAVHSSTKGGVFNRVLDSFPAGIEMAFAYGSGVFQQTGGDMSKNMLDFIFVVKNPYEWHERNMSSNRHHYSFNMTMFNKIRPGSIAHVQDLASGVYFNTLVPFENRLIKYGVISEDRLVSDLRDWETLYVSGRLHKPVKMIIKPSSNVLTGALTTNLENAVCASLLMLPSVFTEEELYWKIASLSYTGDFRMYVAEDKKKVSKIILPNMPHFRRLYQPYLKPNANIYWNDRNGVYEQNKEFETKLQQLEKLPTNVMKNLKNKYEKKNSNDDQNDLLLKLAKDEDCCKTVHESVRIIVTSSSIHQSLKGILTAGFVKTIKYSGAKISKMFKGMLSKS